MDTHLECLLLPIYRRVLVHLVLLKLFVWGLSLLHSRLYPASPRLVSFSDSTIAVEETGSMEVEIMIVSFVGAGTWSAAYYTWVTIYLLHPSGGKDAVNRATELSFYVCLIALFILIPSAVFRSVIGSFALFSGLSLSFLYLALTRRHAPRKAGVLMALFWVVFSLGFMTTAHDYCSHVLVTAVMHSLQPIVMYILFVLDTVLPSTVILDYHAFTIGPAIGRGPRQLCTVWSMRSTSM